MDVYKAITSTPRETLYVTRNHFPKYNIKISTDDIIVHSNYRFDFNKEWWAYIRCYWASNSELHELHALKDIGFPYHIFTHWNDERLIVRVAREGFKCPKCHRQVYDMTCYNECPEVAVAFYAYPFVMLGVPDDLIRNIFKFVNVTKLNP